MLIRKVIVLKVILDLRETFMEVEMKSGYKMLHILYINYKWKFYSALIFSLINYLFF